MSHARWLAVAILSLVPIVASADPPRRTPADDSIDRALQFLKRSQESDGSWRSANTKNPGVTALCVMAFLSAGHVPGEGPYAKTVEDGIRWVLKNQQANGLISNDGSLEMYHHGICTLLLAEVVGMTDRKLGEEIRAKLLKAVEVILKAQRANGPHKGGWRYRIAETDGDISVTGWQLMALRAAKNVGCDVPAEPIELAIGYVKRCQAFNGGFMYYPGAQTTVACTGTSILALELCGKDLHRCPENLKGGAYLLKNLPRWGSDHFFYGIYYCSQAMFQLGGNYWEGFRPTLSEQLLRYQNQRDGSWLGTDQGSRIYGANYCTAMGVLALTVEYRYLPIYQRSEDVKGK